MKYWTAMWTNERRDRHNYNRMMMMMMMPWCYYARHSSHDFWFWLIGGVNMYMSCLGELKWAEVNIQFSITDLVVICLTVTSWVCTLWTDTPAISVHVQKDFFLFLCLTDEAAKATWLSHLDTWEHTHSKTEWNETDSSDKWKLSSALQY